MGIKIYYYLVAAIVGFGLILPQHGKQKKAYVILMAVLHTFICGWRYMYLTGDLRKYAATYYEITNSGWFSETVFQSGRNFGFSWLMKLFSALTEGDFQLLLIFIAIVTELAVAIIIYRYSPLPWLSYLLWNCFDFYIFGFSAIKQALAMGLLMLAFVGIMEEKPKKFLLWTLLAGGVHAPALIFLPAYWLAKNRLSVGRLVIYAIAAALVFLFRNQIVTFISDFYYDEKDYITNDRLGGRFLMIAALLLAGVILRGFSGEKFTKLFNLIFMAAVIQMFSGYDNVFTRLADYYFQFLILYLPMMFYPESDTLVGHSRYFLLTARQKIVALLLVTMLSGLYYYRTDLSHVIDYAPDDYHNYRFSWEVSES